MTMPDRNLKQFLEMNKLLLKNDLDNLIADQVKYKMKHLNLASYYQFSSIFHLPNLMKMTSNFIQSCVTTVAKTQNFLQLDFNYVTKILSSSQLCISSEMEVFHAAYSWLSCDNIDRSKFVKSLIFKTRFPLLSNDVLLNIFQKLSIPCDSSSTHISDESLVLLKKILLKKKEIYINKSTIYFTNRYCECTTFDLLFCGGYDTRARQIDMSIYKTQINDLQKFKVDTRMKKWIIKKAVCLNGELYCFVYDENDDQMGSFQKYSPVSNICKTLESHPYKYLTGFCVCSFKDNIFVMGGFLDKENVAEWDESVWIEADSCTVFDVSTMKWKKVARMAEARVNGACAVFGEKVVVSGGLNKVRGDYKITVEVYDQVDDKWSSFPNMIYGRSFHSLIPATNKLFAIGDQWTNTCEVYDTLCNKFVLLKQIPSFINFRSTFVKPVFIGKKIFVFGGNSSKAASYHVDEDEWSVVPCEVTKNIENFTCLKVPRIQ